VTNDPRTKAAVSLRVLRINTGLIDSHSASDKIGFVPEQKAMRGPADTTQSSRPLSVLCFVCFRLYRLGATPAGARGGVADSRVR
jgi:hypothetical protein